MYMVAPPKASDAPASDVRGAATDDGARIVNQAHALVQLAGTASLVCWNLTEPVAYPYPHTLG